MSEREGFLPEHFGQGAENDFFAGDGDSHVVIEAELFLGASEEALKLGVRQEGDGDYVSAAVLADVNREVAFRDVVVAVLLAETRTPFEDLFEDGGLSELGRFPDDSHFCGSQSEREEEMKECEVGK